MTESRRGSNTVSLVASCFLDVAEWDAGVEGFGDQGVPEAVRRDPLRDPAALREAISRLVSGVAVHPLSVGSEEDRLGRKFGGDDCRGQASMV